MLKGMNNEYFSDVSESELLDPVGFYIMCRQM